jgi:protein SCO1
VTAAKSLIILAALLVAGVLVVACKPTATETAATEATVYRVRGVIRKIKNEGRIAVIDHEEIPGFMERMVMPFHARDGAVFSGVKPGDQVEFDYLVRETEAWVENVTITGTAEVPPDSVAEPETSLLQTGDPLPDHAFVDQEGQPRRLSDFRGKTVALTFIFTRCPAPDFCPKMMRHFAETASLLKDAKTDWQLLTISFDPENDTPALLKAYGEAHGFDPARWTLLVGDAPTTESIAKQVGLRYGKTEDTGSYQHNLRTVVVRPDGAVSRIFLDDDWTPTDLAAAINAK